MSSVAPDLGADLDALLASRLRRTLQGSVLEQRVATVVFDAGHSQWTVELDRGRGRVRRGAAVRPTLAVRGSPGVLADVISGRASGVHAFLHGQITIRGDLGLSLQLDGLFEDDEATRPVQFPRAKEVLAMGVRTAYLEAGPPDAPPLLMLHGLGATNASLLPCLADLARDHRVIAPDLPGFGQSAAPPVSYRPAWYAAWVEALQHELGARRAILLGNSLGGRIALEAGHTHPQSVRGLVLLTPSPAFRRLREWVPAVRLLRPELANLPIPLSHRLVVEAIRGMFSDPDRLPKPWYDAAADECVRVFRSRAHRVAFFSVARQIYVEDAYGRHGFWDRLPGLQPPALFVWGDRDRLVPASFARHVANALPEAGSIVLEDSGHVPQFEHPVETMAVVRGFLSGLPS
ncbi:MAG: Pimeloyl-ACP methyl ester carboxylesterase [Frankiales bacterium]|nr:Pimeloyl-ACP methyl ester carboxylesterase [Frankiales bacterium]